MLWQWHDGFWKCDAFVWLASFNRTLVNLEIAGFCLTRTSMGYISATHSYGFREEISSPTISLIQLWELGTKQSALTRVHCSLPHENSNRQQHLSVSGWGLSNTHITRCNSYIYVYIYRPNGMAKWVEHPSSILADWGIRTSWFWTLVESNQLL